MQGVFYAKKMGIKFVTCQPLHTQGVGETVVSISLVTRGEEKEREEKKSTGEIIHTSLRYRRTMCAKSNDEKGQRGELRSERKREKSEKERKRKSAVETT